MSIMGGLILVECGSCRLVIVLLLKVRDFFFFYKKKKQRIIEKKKPNGQPYGVYSKVRDNKEE